MLKTLVHAVTLTHVETLEHVESLVYVENLFLLDTRCYKLKSLASLDFRNYSCYN